jgi:uncharacterized protein
MKDVIAYLLLGLIAGTFSGLIGIGGAIIIIPALVWVFGMSQHHAQGTTLALMVPPIGLLAAWTYYREKYVDVPVAALICVGFFLGGFLGSRLAIVLPELALRRIFGFALLLISIRMLVGK